MITRARSLLLALPLALGVLAADPAISFSAATITIVNLDGAGEGFNDPTPAAPVGGNPGVTIGQQRLNVFNQAASIWGATLTSAVPILVQAQFNPLTCNATSAVLGSAGTINVSRDFAGAEFAATWYHTALASKQFGADVIPGGNDINSQFNSNLGQPGCLTGSFFYYGFDHNEGGNVDLLAVVLHELGHGLGFSAFANLATGAQLVGFPGIYERKLLDNTNGLHWNQMNDAQRAASAINTGNVVFDGTANTVKAPSFLDPRPEVTITTPPIVAGTYTSGTASFGTLTSTPFVGQVVLAVDGTGPVNDGCEPLTNAGAMAGKIGMVDRGTCSFNVKAQNLQAAGAIGMIMVNNVSGLAPDIGGTDPTITIPVTSLSQATGNAVKAQLGSGVTASLRFNNARLAGADNSNRVMVFTPNPVQGGSSISHYDVTTFPNLLMEPAINNDLTGIDLTRWAFEDLGWFAHTTSVPEAPLFGMKLVAAPNPFAALTRVDFSLPRPMSLTVDVLDLSGRQICNLARSPMAVGEQSVSWNGEDASGRRAAPGVYLVRVKAGADVQMSRVALVR